MQRADRALHHPWLAHPLVSPVSSLTLSSNLLDGLCPVMLLFQQRLRRLKSSVRTGVCDLRTYIVGSQGTRTVCQPDTWLLLLVSTAVRDFSYSAKHLYSPYINSRTREKYCIHIAYVHDLFVKLLNSVEYKSLGNIVQVWNTIKKEKLLCLWFLCCYLWNFQRPINTSVKEIQCNYLFKQTQGSASSLELHSVCVSSCCRGKV